MVLSKHAVFKVKNNCIAANFLQRAIPEMQFPDKLVIL